MNTGRLTKFTLAGITIACLLVIGMQTEAAAQGRGRATAAERSGGRSEAGLSRAAESSGGRSEMGLERARTRSGIPDGTQESSLSTSSSTTLSEGENNLNRFRGIAQRLNSTPEALQMQFETARSANSNLKFGHFVAANMIASNLNATNPNITTAAILSGLQEGRSIGQTLHDLGLSDEEAMTAEKEAKRAIKSSKKKS